MCFLVLTSLKTTIQSNIMDWNLQLFAISVNSAFGKNCSVFQERPASRPNLPLTKCGGQSAPRVDDFGLKVSIMMSSPGGLAIRWNDGLGCLRKTKRGSNSLFKTRWARNDANDVRIIFWIIFICHSQTGVHFKKPYCNLISIHGLYAGVREYAVPERVFNTSFCIQ